MFPDSLVLSAQALFKKKKKIERGNEITIDSYLIIRNRFCVCFTQFLPMVTSYNRKISQPGYTLIQSICLIQIPLVSRTQCVCVCVCVCVCI